MSKKTITTYYCDRCGNEIRFEHIKPTLYYNLNLDNSWLSFYERREKEYELCNECGEKMVKFLKGAELTEQNTDFKR